MPATEKADNTKPRKSAEAWNLVLRYSHTVGNITAKTQHKYVVYTCNTSQIN